MANRNGRLFLRSGQSSERSDLAFRAVHSEERPEGSVGHASAARRPGQCKDAFLDGRGESQERYDLRDPGAGEAFTAGNVGLGGDLACVDLTPPLNGPAEERGHPRRAWLARRTSRLAWRDGNTEPGRKLDLSAVALQHYGDLEGQLFGRLAIA